MNDVFDRAEIERLIDAVSRIQDPQSVRSRGGMYAVRNLLQVSPATGELAHSAQVTAIIGESLSLDAFPVRGTLFDKTAGANWLLPWHQDLTVCVERRIDVPGYGPWSIKAGVCCVQPPIPVLEKMLSVRIHLDDCGEESGALRVLRKTHLGGRLTPAQIEERRSLGAPFSCCVKAGDVMLMKPLLLHASSAASKAMHRRVIHIDYSCVPLAGGLEWQTLAAKL